MNTPPCHDHCDDQEVAELKARIAFLEKALEQALKWEDPRIYTSESVCPELAQYLKEPKR